MTRPARIACFDSGRVTRPNVRARAGAQVAAGLEQALVDAVEEPEQRQDHVRDVAVHEAQTTVIGSPASQLIGEAAIGAELQHLVHVAVRLQQL